MKGSRMYAIIATGGKQYKVAEGDVIAVEKLDAQPGDKVELPVLLLSDCKSTVVGSAPLQDKTVTAEILEQFKAMMAGTDPRTEPQCKMGAPESNMNWQEIKNALDEQDFEAFWVVEREKFYADHDQCLAEDAAYVKNNVK